MDDPLLSPLFQLPEQETVWERSIIKDENFLVARLGPTGGKRGYGAITGEPPSEKSVIWWINDKLLPDIYVERGKTYHFRVQGGDGRQHVESNHPLYITSDQVRSFISSLYTFYYAFLTFSRFELHTFFK